MAFRGFHNSDSFLQRLSINAAQIYNNVLVVAILLDLLGVLAAGEHRLNANREQMSEETSEQVTLGASYEETIMCRCCIVVTVHGEKSENTSLHVLVSLLHQACHMEQKGILSQNTCISLSFHMSMSHPCHMEQKGKLSQNA